MSKQKKCSCNETVNNPGFENGYDIWFYLKIPRGDLAEEQLTANVFVLVVLVMNTLALLLFLSILHPHPFASGNMSTGCVFL